MSLLYKWLANHGIDLPSFLREAYSRDLYNIYELRSGKGHRRRQIEEPQEDLKKIQQALIPLFEKYPLHEACMARKGRSIKDNAAVHENAKHLLRVDIKRCYANTTFQKVLNALDDLSIVDYDRETSELWIEALAFCTILLSVSVNRRILPTGAPTSPILCNIALTPLDHEIVRWAEAAGYKYTRYIDDLHFSVDKGDRDTELLRNVRKALSHYKYQVNEKKTGWTKTRPQDNTIVTGVRIGADSKVPKGFRRMLRAKLQNLAREGKEIDQEAMGCLAYVKSLDKKRYNKLLAYYQRRRQYEADK